MMGWVPENPIQGFFTNPNNLNVTQPDPFFSLENYLFLIFFPNSCNFSILKRLMHENAIKRIPRVNFWKNSDNKKPESQPETEVIFQNPTDLNLKKISKPESMAAKKY